MTIQCEGNDCTDHVLTTCANGSLNNETEISEPAHSPAAKVVHSDQKQRTKRQHSKFRFSLRSRRLEVVGERENGCARGRHARGEGAPARKAPENRFNSHSVSADISNWSRGSRGKN